MRNKYLRLIRMDNWIKNFLIFAPLFFGQQLGNIDLLIKTTIAFISFSLVASCAYIINDYFDIEEDGQHPVKKYRPLASGEVSVKTALFIAVVCLVVGLSIGAFLSLTIFYILLIYIGVNALYNFKLKHLAVIDVCTVSIMYIMRLLVGSETAGVNLSAWIVLITFLMAVFISLAKRRDDVIFNLATGAKTRKSASGYNLEYLNSSMVIMAAAVIICYIIYTTSPLRGIKVYNDKLYLTSIFVILAILRYLQILLVENKSGSPIKIFTEDRFIQLSAVGWIISFGIFLYI